MKRIRVTVWQSPEELVQTAHGPMPFGIWCELERWRLHRVGYKATVIGRLDKRIVLFRWPFRHRPVTAQ